MNDNKIILRVYAAAADEEQAKLVAEALVPLLTSDNRIIRSRVKRYWKTMEYFEIFFELAPIDEISRAFKRMMKALGTGWEVHQFKDGGDWAVWNPSSNSNFCSIEVRWANLECLKI